MNKLLLVAVSVSVGFSAGALGFAAASFAGTPMPLAAIPTPPVKPAVPPILPPGIVIKDKLVTVTCPATAPAMFATLGSWQQFAWAGTVSSANYSDLRKEIGCLYVINNDPTQIVTMLTQKAPVNATSCAADQKTKSVTCVLLLK